jgi:hypothetical protein
MLVDIKMLDGLDFSHHHKNQPPWSASISSGGRQLGIHAFSGATP